MKKGVNCLSVFSHENSGPPTLVDVPARMWQQGEDVSQNPCNSLTQSRLINLTGRPHQAAGAEQIAIKRAPILNFATNAFVLEELSLPAGNFKQEVMLPFVP